MNTNNMIYIWRIVFTSMIALFHFDNVYSICNDLGHYNGWYIAVEFFFIVSGFLLYHSAVNEKKYSSGWSYIKKRYSQIYPIYLLGFLITFYFKSEGNFSVRISTLFDNFWEMVGLQCVGLNRGWSNVNPTAWYISALLICSFFLFFLLRHYERLTVDFLTPLCIMVFYSWMYRYKGNLDFVVEMEGFYLNGALMRGMADMCLGIVAARLNKQLKEHATNLLAWKVTGTVGFLFVIVYSLTNGYTNWDFIMAIILTVCVAIAFLPNEKLTVPNFVKKWSKCSLGVYLIHEIFRTMIFPSILGVPEKVSHRLALGLIYYVTVTMAGILLTVISEQLKKIIFRCSSKFWK